MRKGETLQRVLKVLSVFLLQHNNDENHHHDHQQWWRPHLAIVSGVGILSVDSDHTGQGQHILWDGHLVTLLEKQVIIEAILEDISIFTWSNTGALSLTSTSWRTTLASEILSLPWSPAMAATVNSTLFTCSGKESGYFQAYLTLKVQGVSSYARY